MSTFTTSRGTRCQHVEPRFQSAPYSMHPGRREHLFGRVQSMRRHDVRQDLNIIAAGFVVALLVILFFAHRMVS